MLASPCTGSKAIGCPPSSLDALTRVGLAVQATQAKFQPTRFTTPGSAVELQSRSHNSSEGRAEVAYLLTNINPLPSLTLPDTSDIIPACPASAALIR